MELSWSTFLLEIINFLVLIWILKRFLFNPVRAIIARRRAAIDTRIQEAEALQAEAQRLKQHYQTRLSDWEAEKRQLQRTLTEELATEKAKRLAEIATQIEIERERNRVAQTRQQGDLRRGMEETAIHQAAAFASRLLREAADAETEARLIDIVIGELDGLEQNRIEAFRAAQGEISDIRIASAHGISQRQRDALQASLSSLFPAQRPIRFERDAKLLAGIRISTGNWVLGCNLKDELAGFTELGHDA